MARRATSRHDGIQTLYGVYLVAHDAVPLLCHPRAIPTPRPKLFHCFMELPVEIHLLIFQFCDTPTLFHLLHTSSYTRHHCLELFWEPEHNIWYRLENMDKLLDQEFRVIMHCPEFASRIKQVELDFHCLHSWRWEKYTSWSFWKKVQEILPAARTVVISGFSENPPLPPPPGEFSLLCSSLAELEAAAPQNITVFVAFPYGEFEGSLRQRLWRIEAGAWRIVEDLWTPMRVVLPRKKVPIGPLGELLSLIRVLLLRYLEGKGLNWLREETYSCYRDTSEIECPHPGCNSMFPTPEEMKQHARLKRHEALQSPDRESRMTAHRNTPIELKAVFDKKQRRCDKMGVIFNALLKSLRARYGEQGTAEYQQFEDTVAAQMKEHGYLTPEQSLFDSDTWIAFLYQLDDEMKTDV